MSYKWVKLNIFDSLPYAGVVAWPWTVDHAFFFFFNIEAYFCGKDINTIVQGPAYLWAQNMLIAFPFGKLLTFPK